MYVPMAEPLPNKLPSNLLRSVVARVYKAGKIRTHKKKKTVNSSAKKPRRVSKKPKRQTKVKKVKKVSNKKLTFQNF